ncbi:MAG: exodeoxyribonuclease VII large subunit [Candidatus Eiseniibacteriota bacterium]
MPVTTAADQVLSVSEITRRIAGALEAEFSAVWVRGELSGLKRADSGHLYFTLKEGRDAALSCVMWRASAARLPFDPRDGIEVEAFGGVEVYAPRGQYQLIIRELRPAGRGALLLALEELKRRLQDEGLFDESRKRPLPRYPARIGLVTSPSGAAVRDLVRVLRSRWPSIELTLAPVRVQGEGAAQEIAAAIQLFNRQRAVDLLIVGRGGGSLEDLWAFNEEPVVRAIAGSDLPVISAVGHEVDWTLADLAADVRAATPSHAAEIAVPERAEVARAVAALANRLERSLRQALGERRRHLESLVEKYGFRRIRDFFGLTQQRIDDARQRIGRALSRMLEIARERLAAVRGRYGLREWPRQLAQLKARATDSRARLEDSALEATHARRRRLTAALDRLRALSPRLVLERGYCLARGADGTLVRGMEALSVGERLTLEFARGEADARIEEIRRGGE